MTQIVNLRGARIIAFEGCHLTVTDPDSGEVVGEVPIPPGPARLDEYAALAAVGVVEVHGGVLSSTAGRISTARSEYFDQSAAATEYRMSHSERQERQMRLMMRQMIDQQLARENASARVRQDAERERDRGRNEAASQSDSVIDETETYDQGGSDDGTTSDAAS